MKLRRVAVENVRSFLDSQELSVPGPISIIIGPNGGGKTNLLDTIVTALRLYVLKSWTPRHNPQVEWQDRYDWEINGSISRHLLDKHRFGRDLPQRIEFDLEATKTDIANIVRLRSKAAELREKSKHRYTSFPLADRVTSWGDSNPRAGEVFTYRIVDGSMQNEGNPAWRIFLDYLESYEIAAFLNAEFMSEPLSMPMISLPVNRASSGVIVSVGLSGFNEYDQKKSVDSASSRSSGPIMGLAVGRMALRYRDLLEFDNGEARKVFQENTNNKNLSDTLADLGYSWELKCVNTRTNEYAVQLTKQGLSFLADSASSGEREILNYLFGIYGLNVRDALIVVDEPELHLHPRWQKILLGLFEKLSEDTGNQFVMATHSPVFVSPASIQYVSRVSSIKQRSVVVRLSRHDLPEQRHLFSIVNSQNNEKLFFADLVVLVEGLSDRIFFEAVFRHFGLGSLVSLTCEIIAVGGKHFFKSYQKLLDACGVPYAIVADLDYLQQIGDASIAAHFAVDRTGIKAGIVDEASYDGAALVDRLDDAIRTRETAELERLWNYIKGRHTRLKLNLSPEERAVVDECILQKYAEAVFVLKRGTLESYLPEGCRHKDLNKLIQLTAAPDFWSRIPEVGKAEIEEIVRKVFDAPAIKGTRNAAVIEPLITQCSSPAAV